MKISGKTVRRGGIALVLAGLALARIARGESPPPAAFAPGDVHDVTFVHLLKDDSRRFDRIWEPYIATWTDSGVDDAVNRMTVNPQANLVAGRGLGRTVVMVAYGRKLAGKTDMGDIVCARSLDGGKTWWEPVTVFDSSAMNGTQQFAFANAILFHPSNQNLVWCFAMRCPLDFSDSEDSHMCAAYSADGGLSWHPVELVMHYHQPLAIIPGVLEVKVNGNTRSCFRPNATPAATTCAATPSNWSWKATISSNGGPPGMCRRRSPKRSSCTRAESLGGTMRVRSRWSCARRTWRDIRR